MFRGCYRKGDYTGSADGKGQVCQDLSPGSQLGWKRKRPPYGAAGREDRHGGSLLQRYREALFFQDHEQL